MSFMKMRTFYKKRPLFIKKLNFAYLQKTQTSNTSFYKTLHFWDFKRQMSLDQWEIKIHLLWGKCFNIPHWPRSHSTNRRLQHIEKLSKTYSGDPHLDQTKLNGLLLLTIHGVLSGHQGGIKCANRRTGLSIAKDLINPKTPKTPNICCFVVKLHLSWFTRFFRGNIPILW